MSTTLAELTTLRLGGPAATVRTAGSTSELVDLVRQADSDGVPVLLLGGGSNLVVGDAGWPGLVIRVGSSDVTVSRSGDGADLLVAAGVAWDALVRLSLDEGLVGLETMSGIPGLVGATPVQNVGAYGAEVADVLTAVTVYDRRTGSIERWSPAQCRFGFRTSTFKHTDRYVVLEVTIHLAASGRSRPVRYLELARRLGVEPGATAAPAEVRATVLELRRSKGMLLDAGDHDTWSVGSFFVNPLVDALPAAAADCPNWPADGRTKLSAAWLIERAGFTRGFGHDRGRGTVSVSNKHTLALTNRGGATTEELLELAGVIRAGVEQRFGIRLGPEARLANCSF